MADPITYSEIGAFNREMLAGLMTWEKDVLIQLDDAVLAIVNKTKGPSDGKSKSVGDNIPAHEPKTVLAMFRRLMGGKPKRKP